MPPKRQSTENSGSAAKKAKTVDPSDPPRNKRWSKVSGSGNADDGYNHQIRRPEAYDYICLCKPFHRWGSDGDDEEDEDEDEEDEDEDNAEKVSREAPSKVSGPGSNTDCDRRKRPLATLARLAFASSPLRNIPSTPGSSLTQPRGS